MFDIGFAELVLIMVVGLLVLGPERLPGAVRTASLWIGRIRRSFQEVRADIEREIGADEIRQQLHNESILKQLEASKQDLQKLQRDLNQDLTRELNSSTDTTTDDNTANANVTHSALTRTEEAQQSSPEPVSELSSESLSEPSPQQIDPQGDQYSILPPGHSNTDEQPANQADSASDLATTKPTASGTPE